MSNPYPLRPISSDANCVRAPSHIDDGLSESVRRAEIWDERERTMPQDEIDRAVFSRQPKCMQEAEKHEAK